jgi:hypothetical protein
MVMMSVSEQTACHRPADRILGEIVGCLA